MYTTAELAQVFWDLFCYFVYLAARSIFHSIDALFFNLRPTRNQNQAPLALVSKILFRHRRDPFDCAKPENFLTKRQYLVRSEDVITPDNDRIALYCLNRQYATFIELPKSISEYSASTTSFIWLGFYRDARRTIRIPVSELHRLGSRFGDPQMPIVLLWNSGRCGSTLLCKLITSANPRVLALCEPDVFSSLHALIKECGPDEISTKDTELIRSALRVFFRRIPNVDGFVVKPRMFCTDLLPIIHNILPEIKHALLYRRNVMDIVRSYEKCFRPIQDIKLYYMATNSALFPLIQSMVKVPTIRQSSVAMQAADTSGLKFSVFELMCRAWAIAQVTFVRYKEFFEGHVYPYEDFVKAPLMVLEDLFGLLKLEMPNAKDIGERMKSDAQADTPLGREAVKENEKMLTPWKDNPDLQKRVKKFIELITMEGDI